MLLTLKNKMLMGLDRMIEEAHKQKYAVIKEILLDLGEVRDIVREVNAHEDRNERMEIKKLFKVEGDEYATVIALFQLNKKFIDKWYKQEYNIYYKEVKLTLTTDVSDYV